MCAVAYGDTIVFDNVSRMSGNADGGSEMYESLFQRGVTLFFLKEQDINTDVYRKTLEKQINLQLSTENLSCNLIYYRKNKRRDWSPMKI